MHNINEILSHPYITTPVATVAVVNPLLVDYLNTGLPIALQILGGIFLVIQIFYIIKNKGKK